MKIKYILKWLWSNRKTIWIEYNPGLKHWGKSVELYERYEITPYFRFYAFFIYKQQPILID